MRLWFVRMMLVVVGLGAFHSDAWAQASIAGAVRDSSGGALPGVSVEAASPVLIERSRTVVTDAQGRYNIIDLRPGTYAVTFTLPGFNTVKRDGLILTGGIALSVNADLSVGGVEETLVVTGDTPVVDVRNVRQQSTLGRELLDAIPRARGQQLTGALLPGVVSSNNRDVGGSQGLTSTTTLSIHGSDSSDSSVLIDGMRVAEGLRGHFRQLSVPDAAVQEYVYETSAISAETLAGGVRMDLIPKEGGNQFKGFVQFNVTTRDMVAGNLSEKLKARGLTAIDGINKIFDLSPAVGGPLKASRLWYFASARYQGKDSLPTDDFFESDPTKQLVDVGRYTSVNVRLTGQVTPRNKVNLYIDRQTRHMPTFGTSALVSPEASINIVYPLLYNAQLKWTSPITNKLLVELGVNQFQENQRFYYSQYSRPGALPHVEITTGKTTQANPGAGSGNCASIGCVGDHQFVTTIGKVSYVTGAHNLKVGMSLVNGCHCKRYDPLPPVIRTNNGVPFQLQLIASPRFGNDHLKYEFGMFVQDQWTLNRVTVNLGVRFDALNEYVEAQNAPAGPFVGPRSWPEIPNVPNWKDISPRFGLAWDVFGTGKTAVKASASRYLYSDWTSFANSVNPLNSNLTLTDTRTVVSTNGSADPYAWTLGPSTNLNFGKAALSVSPDPSVSEGWGVRGYNWEYAVSLQQQLRPGLSVNVGYFRRTYGNLTWTNNTLVSPSDFTPVAITNPITASPLTIYNLNPAKRGVANSVIQFAPDNSQVFNGVDVTATGRFGRGVQVTAGVTTGRTITDSCTAWDPNTTINCVTKPGFMAQNQYKILGSYPLPYDFQFSGTFISLPGPAIAANYAVTSAIAGVTLTNGTITVPLVDPQSTFGDRLNRLDIRAARNWRFGTRRVQPFLDLYNLLNVSPVLTLNTTYGPTWQRPTATLIGRMLQVGVQFDF